MFRAQRDAFDVLGVRVESSSMSINASAPNVADGSWHFVAIVMKGAVSHREIQLYIDGSRVAHDVIRTANLPAPLDALVLLLGVVRVFPEWLGANPLLSQTPNHSQNRRM